MSTTTHRATRTARPVNMAGGSVAATESSSCRGPVRAGGSSRPDARGPWARPGQPANPGSQGPMAGPSLVRIALRAAVPGAVGVRDRPSSPAHVPLVSPLGARTTSPIRPLPLPRSRTTEAGWQLTTRGLAVVMVGFIAALVLGGAVTIRSFVVISGTDQPAVRTGAVAMVAQVPAQQAPATGSVSDGS